MYALYNFLPTIDREPIALGPSGPIINPMTTTENKKTTDEMAEAAAEEAYWERLAEKKYWERVAERKAAGK